MLIDSSVASSALGMTYTPFNDDDDDDAYRPELPSQRERNPHPWLPAPRMDAISNLPCAILFLASRVTFTGQRR